mmetsp:Transcript_59242/g.152459  ORF Transcript_59242/g.152459 Transcript_59242/m.152459 type:complete len:310 (+) Transcript_59242:97-1026(+)
MFSLLRGAPEDDEVAQMLAQHGWDKGLVCFGLQSSENVVKITTALNLLMKQDNFPHKTCRYVELQLNSKAALQTAKDGSQSMGVYSATWQILSSGRQCMPAVAIDGKVMMDSCRMLEELWTNYPDRTLNWAELAEVKRLLEINSKYSERLQQALKHWGWSAMNSTRANYKDFGPGKKDLAWEKETVKTIDAFFGQLEEHLRKRKNDGLFNGYLVGKKLTLADCAFINWPLSFSLVVGLDVAKRYPLTWANSENLKMHSPAGSQEFYDTFPIFGHANGMMNMRNRGTWCFCFCGKGFHIENPVYWSERQA